MKKLATVQFLLSVLAISPAFLSLSAGASNAVSAREEEMTLPTYKVAPPDTNPRFYSGRTYQGARATFYPYPVYDEMTEERVDSKYKAVKLENEYIEFSVLPELGGRIFTAVDKGNGYDFFYRQHVIKPALIGMLGAWISGGVEWNVPHHHRATSLLPVQYTLESSPDGSKTVWVGEVEWRHRMKWMVGMTLHPNRSYIEMTARVINRTPEAQSFLFWINPAVHANTNYQVIFPPSVEWTVQHGKPQFASWPIARQVYGGTDYRQGVDISWWKNHPSPVSFFAWNCEEDFFGGYDHGKRAGVAQVSNHHVSPGKKFFEWGNGPQGEMWTKILSDEDGPYLELMAGSYSDNQPDYSWVQPHETKVFKHFWYPIRDLGGIKNANIDAAANFEVSNHVAYLAFNATRAFPQATVRAEANGRPLYEQRVHISPNQPFSERFPVADGLKPEDIRVSLVNADGEEVLAYQPSTPPGTPMPAPVRTPKAPTEIQSAEELYLTGLRVEQLYSPSFDPVPYYLEALKRDPGDYRANTALGSLYCRQGRYAEAEPLLQAASDRARSNYIRPVTCEADYYLGVAQKKQKKDREAWDTLYRAVWDRAWQAPAYCHLAELAAAAGHYSQALELANESLVNGTRNLRALELKAACLRKLNRKREAGQVLETIRGLDPLNSRVIVEQAWLRGIDMTRSARGRGPLARLLGEEVNSYLELAMDCANGGFWQEAAEIMTVRLAMAPSPEQVNPFLHYYLGYFEKQLGHKASAAEHYAAAARMPDELCFPFQDECEGILVDAIKDNPGDGRAHYYLGNLLYDTQPGRAIEAWKRCIELDEQFAPAHRNLGIALGQLSAEEANAIVHLERAVQLDPRNPRLLYELDVAYETAGTPVTTRLNLLNDHADVVARRDDTITRRILVLTAAGDTETALDILKHRHFRNWEGSSGLHQVYVSACLRHGMELMEKRNFQGAISTFESALDYPENQEIGRDVHGRTPAPVAYCLAQAYNSAGNQVAARSWLEKAAETSSREGGGAAYFKALALKEMGRQDEATELLGRLEQRGRDELKETSGQVDYFAKFGERQAKRLKLAEGNYLVAMACLGQGRRDEAKHYFTAALGLNPAHLGALTWSKQ